jgi:hypothetical protein
MFPHLYIAKVVVCLLLALLYHLIYTKSLEEFKRYVDDLSICNAWITAHIFDNAPGVVDNTSVLEASYMEYVQLDIIKNLVLMCKHAPRALASILNDVRGDFLYEDTPFGRMQHVYLQFHDRSIDPVVYSLLPQLVRYVHDMPTSYCCELCVLAPASVVNLARLSFQGLITMYVPLFVPSADEHSTNWLGCYVQYEDASMNLHSVPLDSKPVVIHSSLVQHLDNRSDKHVVFLICQLARTGPPGANELEVGQYLTLFISLCDRIASLTTRFKHRVAWTPSEDAHTKFDEVQTVVSEPHEAAPTEQVA